MSGEQCVPVLGGVQFLHLVRHACCRHALPADHLVASVLSHVHTVHFGSAHQMFFLCVLFSGLLGLPPVFSDGSAKNTVTDQQDISMAAQFHGPSVAASDAPVKFHGYAADGTSPAAAAARSDSGLPQTIQGLSGLALSTPVDASLGDNVMDMDYCILHVEGTNSP